MGVNVTTSGTSPNLATVGEVKTSTPPVALRAGPLIYFLSSSIVDAVPGSASGIFQPVLKAR